MKTFMSRWMLSFLIGGTGFSLLPGNSLQAQTKRLAYGTEEPEAIQQVGLFQRRRSTTCKPCEEVLRVPSEVTTPTPATPQTPAPEAPSPFEAAPPEGATDLFGASLAAATTGAVLAPNMLGDFAGSIYEFGPIVGEGITPAEGARYRTLTRYKVADFTSPIPKTRVLYDFNFFNDAFQAGGNVYRNFAGAEYSFYGDMMSAEIRGSINTFESFPGATNTTEFGDIRTVFKAVGWRNDYNVVSGGVGMNWPTGGFPNGLPAVYTITPFVGYLFSSPNSPFFLQGFQQIDLPTNAADQMLLHTDVGVGYWLRRWDSSRTIQAIVPTIEMHLYTPLGDSPSGSLLGLRYNDVLNTTVGCSFFIGENLLVAVAMGIPVTSIKDYSIEAQCHAEWRFRGGR